MRVKSIFSKALITLLVAVTMLQQTGLVVLAQNALEENDDLLASDVLPVEGETEETVDVLPETEGEPADVADEQDSLSEAVVNDKATEPADVESADAVEEALTDAVPAENAAEETESSEEELPSEEETTSDTEDFITLELSGDDLVTEELDPAILTTNLASDNSNALTSVYVSAEGSDESGDGSAENPFATLAKAYDATEAGATIVLLSDIEQKNYVYIKHDLTIDGQGHTITRAEGFTTASDTARSWYNPALFEIHPDDNAVTVTFKNITIDEQFRHEGTDYKPQGTNPNTGENLKRVQDGIISLYSWGNKATLILDDKTTLKRFGGMSAVYVQPDHELIMKSGSNITNGGENPNKQDYGKGQAVWNLGGTFTMENGSKIDGIIGANAILTDNGTTVINGEIAECKGTSPIRTVGTSTITLGKDGEVHDMDGSGVCVFYSAGGATTYNIDGKFHDVTTGPKRGGIWPSNSAAHVVNITENADIYNIPGQVVRSDSNITVNMSGGKIHDSGVALFIRRGVTCNITGGEIKNNRFGVLLANDSVWTGRYNITSADEVVEGNDYDFFIDWSEAGYRNGSYLYLSAEKLAENPMVVMGDMNVDNYKADVSEAKNFKEVTVPSSNGFMYLGNASKDSKAALKAEADKLGLTNERATWWFEHNSSEAVFDIAKLPDLNDEPLYALHVAVDADGKVAEGAKVVCTPVTVENGVAKVNLSAAAAENGYSVMLAQATPETVKVTINYLNAADKQPINGVDPYTADFVKGSNYDVKSFAEKEIEGCTFASTEGEVAGTLSDNLVINSYYTVTEYKITYELDGGTNAEENPSTYTFFDEVTLKDPTKDGYKFKGWKEGNSIEKGSEGDKTFTAEWEIEEYTITYYLNNGTNAKENPTTYTVEDEITLKDPTLEGYQFKGWKEGNKIAKGSTGNKEFTAQWEVMRYTITYDLGGGTFNGSAEKITENHTHGEIIKIHAAPEKKGYVFVEWRGSSYQPGDSYTVTGEHTFTAIWKEDSKRPSYIVPDTADRD